MKKIIICLVCILTGLSAIAQEQERTRVKGTIQMPEGDGPEGISVFNMTTGRGTVSNNAGEFNIDVALNDSIRVSAVQFQNFTILIDQGIINSEQINILVNEVINFLPEVVVNPYDLTGNVRVDVVRLETVELPDTLRASDVQNIYVAGDEDDYLRTEPRNDAFATSEDRLVNGLNFVNLFKELLQSGKNEQINKKDEDLKTNVRLIYNDEFFKEYMDIKLENVAEFLFYADDNGLKEEMLREGNELDLIQFLIDKSKEFKKQSKN
jgi:hypothetical protein